MAMQKNPISILQELMQHNKKPLPVYSSSDLANLNGNCMCVVTVDGIITEGRGKNKKEAKQNSAKNAISILQSKTGNNLTKTTDVVANLNRNCLCVARVDGIMTEGYGKNKNKAKHNSASNIIAIQQPNTSNNLRKTTDVANLNGNHTCVATVNGIMTKGYGKNKKKVKYNSARNSIAIQQPRTSNNLTKTTDKEANLNRNCICVATVDSIITEGYGKNKNKAKHNSARNTIAIQQPKTSNNLRKTTDVVANLNKNHTCVATVNGIMTEGYGKNKNKAKHNSARNTIAIQQPKTSNNLRKTTDVVANLNKNHTCVATVNGIMAEGYGKYKKKAKHNSARNTISIQQPKTSNNLTKTTDVMNNLNGNSTCVVTVNGIMTVGYGKNKKEAKHNSAKNALAILQYKAGNNLTKTMDVVVPKAARFARLPKKNYVGSLSEYCLKNSISYPEYKEKGFEGYYFSVTCSLNGINVLRKDINKKVTKQEVDRVIFEKVKFSDIWINHPNIERLPMFPHDDPTIKKIIPKAALFDRVPMKNHVVALSEFCLKRSLSYPKYKEKRFNGQYFSVRCSLNGISVVGKDINKKVAKQKAAQVIFEKVKFSDKKKDKLIMERLPKFTRDDPNIKKITKLYNDLTIMEKIYLLYELNISMEIDFSTYLYLH